MANSSFNLTMNTGTNTNANLDLSGGTFSMANAGTYTFNTITFSSGITTLDFAGASGATLQSTNLVISNTASVIVTNWVGTTDVWKSTNAPVVGGTTVSAGGTVSNVTFNGYADLRASWSYSGGLFQQIAPVPEPSTYGAMLMAGCAGLFGLRRWRAKRQAVRG